MNFVLILIIPGIRTSIDASGVGGEIKKYDLKEVLPFENNNLIVEVTGKDIKDALERSVERYVHNLMLSEQKQTYLLNDFMGFSDIQKPVLLVSSSRCPAFMWSIIYLIQRVSVLSPWKYYAHYVIVRLTVPSFWRLNIRSSCLIIFMAKEMDSRCLR